MTKQEPFYGKFIKNANHKQTNTEQKQNKKPALQREAEKKRIVADAAVKNTKDRRRAVLYTLGAPVFSDLTAEAKRIVEHFPDIAARVLPLDVKKQQSLPQHIHRLFHELTDERSSRKAHYLNNPVTLSAYTHYYMWWNLVRFAKLLQNLEIRLDNGDYAADFGSGPLTFICALWIAKPELRNKKLTWYCVDISNKALSFGEDLFLALCAYTEQNGTKGNTPWRIKKICGAFGVPLNEKLALLTEANMFNEIFWANKLSLDEQAQKAHKMITQYLNPNGSALLIEPGIPLAGEFLSLMRTQFLQSGFDIYAPCPHKGFCCFPNRKPLGRSSKTPVAYNKWCHFTFETADSPKNLLRLSDSAKLGKERASLSFLYCTAMNCPPSTGKQELCKPANGLAVRICSDIIIPEPQRIGRYACSARGFMFITGPAYKESVLNTAVSGSLLLLPETAGAEHERDKKTGALLVRLDQVKHG